MTRYFNIDRYERENYGLISIYILLLDTNTSITSVYLYNRDSTVLLNISLQYAEKVCRCMKILDKLL